MTNNPPSAQIKPGEYGFPLKLKARYDNFIGGEWVAPADGEYYQNLTPVTGQLLCEVASSGKRDIDLALDAAHKVKDKWAHTSVQDRAAILFKIADRMEQNLELLATAETWDNGKPIRETSAADVPLAIDHFRYFASCIRAQEGGISEIDSETVAYHFHEPLGVVGQIIPWNFPLLMASWKMAPALAAGTLEAIRQLRGMGIRVVMLTGDHEKTARAIQRELGIERVVAEVLPQDKEKEVRRLQAEGHKVAMVGDGINDAPALARADVGIAIGAGTDVAIESADIVLMKSDLLDAVSAIQLSRAVIKNIKENLFWAFCYNAIGIPLAAGVFYPLLGWQLSPMFGSAAMSFSSVFVVTNALRLKGFKPSFKKGKQEIEPEELHIAAEPVAEKKEKKEMKKKISIEGMMCGHCTGRVEKALNGLSGVEAQVSLEDKAAYVTLTGEVSDELLRKTVEDAGYEVTGITQE